MWRKRFTTSYSFACLVSLALTFACLLGCCALGAQVDYERLRAASCLVSASDDGGATSKHGSGAIIANDGEFALVATAAHVAGADDTRFSVKPMGVGGSFPAEILGTSHGERALPGGGKMVTSDASLLAFKHGGQVPRTSMIELGGDPRPGQWLATVTYPKAQQVAYQQGVVLPTVINEGLAWETNWGSIDGESGGIVVDVATYQAAGVVSKSDGRITIIFPASNFSKWAASPAAVQYVSNRQRACLPGGL